MRVERFEDILAWQRARDLARRIYNQFGCSKDYGSKIKYNELQYL